MLNFILRLLTVLTNEKLRETVQLTSMSSISVLLMEKHQAAPDSGATLHPYGTVQYVQLPVLHMKYIPYPPATSQNQVTDCQHVNELSSTLSLDNSLSLHSSEVCKPHIWAVTPLPLCLHMLPELVMFRAEEHWLETCRHPLTDSSGGKSATPVVSAVDFITWWEFCLTIKKE